MEPIPLLPLLEELEETGVVDAIRERFAEQVANTDDVLARLKQLGVLIECTCEAAPVQFEATFGEYYLFFRSRWNRWRCVIAATKESAAWGSDYLYYTDGECGSDFEASWMPHVEAMELIEQCVVAFTKTLEDRAND